jgi:mannose-6-phosphate isomerase
MWYILEAKEGAFLYEGFDHVISKGEFEERIKNNTLEEVLHKVYVKRGDVIFISPGTLHAIGEGIVIAEIQQNSNVTYRIYDYGRLGADGKPRQLHTELAKEAIDYKVYPDYRVPYTPVRNAEDELVSCKYFTTSVYDLDMPVRKELEDMDSFLVVMCLSGHGTILDSEPVYDSEGRRGPTKGHIIDLRQGETVLIPASSLGITFTPAAGGMKLLTSHL